MLALAIYFLLGFAAIVAVSEPPEQRAKLILVGLFAFLLWPIVIPLYVTSRRIR